MFETRTLDMADLVLARTHAPDVECAGFQNRGHLFFDRRAQGLIEGGPDVILRTVVSFAVLVPPRHIDDDFGLLIADRRQGGGEFDDLLAAAVDPPPDLPIGHALGPDMDQDPALLREHQIRKRVGGKTLVGLGDAEIINAGRTFLTGRRRDRGQHDQCRLCALHTVITTMKSEQLASSATARLACRARYTEHWDSFQSG